MKHTSKQSGRSRNKALAQRAAQLGCGISLIAVSAMLAARPARAGGTNPAQVLLDAIPYASSSAGFVAHGSKQTNIGAPVSAALADASGTSTVDNTVPGSEPSTETVTADELAAFATGNSQTNTVDLATIGSNDEITGIAVMAEQLNTFSTTGEDPTIYTPEDITSLVYDSGFFDETTNAVNGDTLTDSSNLIEAQTTGNTESSSVTGTVPVGYASPQPGSSLLNYAFDNYADDSGSASGNVVVGNSQLNDAIDGSIGSYATIGNDDISLDVTSTGVEQQFLTIDTGESNNAISSVFLGNSADNDIGLLLTSGDVTGAPTFGGALVVANQQDNLDYNFTGDTADGLYAYNDDSSIATTISGGAEAPITLTDGAITEDGNLISSSATGNSAAGADGAAGNQISLGINLAGATPAIDAGNSMNSGGTVSAGGDLVLTNQQYQSGVGPAAFTTFDGIAASAQNMAGSSIGLANNGIVASALGNNAANAIDTTGAGINLISGLAALSSQQGDFSGGYAAVGYSGIAIYAGTMSGGLSVTNSSQTLTDNKITTTVDNNQITNSVSLAASTIDAGALGAAAGPAVVSSTNVGDKVADAGLSLNNVQVSAGEADAHQFYSEVAAYVMGHTISNDSVINTNPVLTSEATADSATNSIIADGSQGMSGSIGLSNAQWQEYGGADAYLDDGTSDSGNAAGISLQSTGGAQGISGSSAVLSGSELYAEATSNNASNTLDAMGGTLSNAGAEYGTLGLAAQFGNLGAVAGQGISDLALVNAQTEVNGEAYAENYESNAFINVDSTDGTLANSSFVVSGPANDVPTAQALAIGNEALNALSALATTVLTDTAGLVNAQADNTGAQANLDYADVYADINTYYVYDPAYQSGDDGGNVDDVSVTVGTGATGGSNANILRALAYGNQASNVLSASAGTVNPDVTAGSFAVDGSVIPDDDLFDTSLTGPFGVGAAYALLSDQTSGGTITAEATNPQIGIYIGNTDTDPTFTDITASTAGNAIVTSAFGNQASNGATVAANNLAADIYYPVADVTNLQTNSGTVGSSLSYDFGADAPMLAASLYGTGEVLDSTLGVTDNTVLTQAEGNEASNSLDTTGGNITDVAPESLGDVQSATFNDGNSLDTLAFSVQNVQLDTAPIEVDQTGSAAVVSTGGDVDGSTLAADTNAFEATGYGSNATNSLDFGGTTPVNLLDSSAGLQNVQYTEGNVSSTLGSAGEAATPGTPAIDVPEVDYTVANNDDDTNEAYVSNTNTLNVVGQPLVFNLGSLTDAQRTAFEDAIPGGDFVSGYYTLTAGSYVVDNLAVLDGSFIPTTTDLYYTDGSSISDQHVAAFDTEATEGTPAVPPSPDVLITVAGDITNSTLDVSNNAFDATAIGANAVNSESIAATTVNGGADVSGEVGGQVDDTGGYGNTDYTLVNIQSFGDTATAVANGEAGINPDNTSTISDSTLSVNNNTEVAKAEADIASNTLTLSATDTGSGGTAPTLSLVNNQGADGDAVASVGTYGSGFDFGLAVTAPGAISDSTLTMDDNSSEALAVENNATNLLSADATNLADATDGANASAEAAVYSDSDNYADLGADYSVTNSQSVYEDSVTASNLSYVLNSDSPEFFDIGSGDETTNGLFDSSVSVSGNTTSAFAQANAASNTLDMTSANSTATGAVTNVQSSGATVTAYGADYTGFALNGGTDDGPAAATNSSISVTNNSTQVQGIGNQASNALNADTGATYGAQNVASIDPTGDGSTTASATYAVLNEQSNTGPVSASGGAYYVSGLNGGDGLTTPVSNTTVTVSYNTVDIKAFGNSATNSATVSTLNSGNATVALANVQTNTAAITATGDGTQIGSYIGGPGASDTTVEVGNNSVVASAVGNVATNAIAHQ